MTARRVELPAQVRHFQRWIHLTGCKYAAHLDKTEKLSYFAPAVGRAIDEDTLSDFELLIDADAPLKRAVVGLFAGLRTPAHVAQLLARLAGRPRWTCSSVGSTRADGTQYVGLTWRTPAGESSSVMGLAPFGTMPVPRRAPFVALVVWGGGHDNQNAPWRNVHPGGTVGVIDVPTGLSQSDDKRLLDITNEKVRELLALADPADDPRTLRDVAFALRGSDLRK